MTSSPKKIIPLGKNVHRLKRVGDDVPEPQPEGEAPGAPPQVDLTAALKAEYERGLQEGSERAQRELQPLLQALRQACTQLQAHSTELQKSLDRYATHLSLRIAGQILARELEQDTAVQQMLARLLAEIPVRQGLRLRLNPRDAAHLETLRGKALSPEMLLPVDTVLVADETITKGGCVIESPVGQIDARIETQLQLIERALSGEAGHKRDG